MTAALFVNSFLASSGHFAQYITGRLSEHHPNSVSSSIRLVVMEKLHFPKIIFLLSSTLVSLATKYTDYQGVQ